MNSQQLFINRHFFDIFDKIGTVLHPVPFFVAHPHKKAARRTFNPGFIMVREFCTEG
jgi:hypothetical protein